MDRFDRKTVLLTMYGGFALSTLLCGLVPNFGLMLAARCSPASSADWRRSQS